MPRTPLLPLALALALPLTIAPARSGRAQDHEHGAHGAHGAHQGHGPAAAHGGKGPLGHRFKKAEDWVRVFDDPARDAWQKPAEIVRLLAVTPGMTVADVGAGTGYLEPYLARAVGGKGKVLALDVEADMVRHLKKRAAHERLGAVEPRLVPFDDPKLAPGSVDRVVILDTWHHIPDRKAYGQKLLAALRPGGQVMIVDFTLESERGPPREHRIAPGDVAAELGAAGFEAATIEETLPDHYIVVAAPAKAALKSDLGAPKGR